MASSEIHMVQTTSGNQARARRIIEEAGQVFQRGVPVQIAAGDGGVKEWDGATVAFGIAGFSLEPGNNLTTVGVALQATFPGGVPNQTLAQNISRPYFNDGRMGFEAADVDTVFRGQVGPAQTALATDVGKQYGMTKDTDNHWFVDKTKLTVGTNTVVQIVKLDPSDAAATPRGVYFVVLPGAAQLLA